MALWRMRKEFRPQLFHCFHHCGCCKGACNVTMKHDCFWQHFCSFAVILRFQFPLSHVAFTSILRQYLMEMFSRFRSLCAKKSHYCTLFNNGAVPLWSVHVHLTFASTRLKAEYCTVCIWSIHQPLWKCCIESVSIHCSYCIIFKLHLLFYSLS